MKTPTADSNAVSPDTISQVGAGALLAAVSVAELWLAFWEAGSWHRAGGVAVALAGVTILSRAIVAMRRPVHRPDVGWPTDQRALTLLHIYPGGNDGDVLDDHLVRGADRPVLVAVRGARAALASSGHTTGVTDAATRRRVVLARGA